MNTFIFLRHGETIKDPLIPVVAWKLSEDTVKAIADLSAEVEFSDITSIYSSHEHKAQKSAEAFAQRLNIPITIWDGLEEVHRGETYVTDEKFAILKREKLEQRDSAQDGGEAANQALERFKKAITEIDNRHVNEKILISSHGTILALYFADLKHDYSNIFTYWKNMPFCSVGIVSNSKIIKDISFLQLVLQMLKFFSF